MHVTIVTVGSRGDVQPYVALGAGIQAAGHHVRLATHSTFEAIVRAHGLEFFPVGGDPRQTLEGRAGQDWTEAGSNFMSFMGRMLDATGSSIFDMLSGFWDACQETELLLFPVLPAIGLVSVAEKLGIPAFPAYLQHVHPTRACPSAMIAPQPRLGGLYNRLTYPLGTQIFWQFLRRATNEWRRKTLGLPAYPFSGPFGGWLKERWPTLYGFSPQVVPKPPEWGDEVHVTGYWFLDADPDWTPPRELAAFLEAGPPPVFIGFGSMTDRDPQQVAALAAAALERAGQRGLLLSGWAGMSIPDLPPHLFILESAPFDWLFPRMAAVVHHGGAGTTATGLRAGVPSVVVPFFGDQFFWGWRVHALGAGPAPLPRRVLSVKRLGAAIEQAVRDPEMRANAAQLGRLIRAENGVQAAVQALQAHGALPS